MIRFLIAFLMLAAPLRAEVDIQVVETPAGHTAWLVEDHSIPFMALELTFAGGASLDRPGKRGAAYLMTGLIEEGAGDMDARTFQAAREALAADFGFNVTDDRLSISARMLSENREEALTLLRAALVDPRFDQDAVDRVRGQVLSGIRSDAADPNALAGQALYARLYGDHPYGSPMEGTEESVNALTRDDIVNAHADLMVKSRVIIAAVGDITPEQLGVMVDDLLAEMPAEGPELVGPANPTFDGTLELTDFATPQSVALFAQPGMDQDHPDFFAAYILNSILGGSGRQSRLMEEVREKRGLTYGVYSYLVGKEQANVMLGSLASANGNMAEALDVIRAEWDRIATEGVTEEELESAKIYITGAYPLRFDGNGRIAGILAGLQIMGLSPDYVNTRNDEVNAVTLEQINRVAGELLDPSKLTISVAGQPEGIE